MSDIIFEAPPRSRDSIEALADAVRKMVGFTEVPYFPIVPFVEKVLPVLVEGLTFDIVEGDVLGARMGAVDPLTREFMIREDVYLAAVAGIPRHRFTLSHESGHALMHIGTLNRLPTSPRGRLEAFRDPEWQANQFAASLLMPRHLVTQYTTIAEIMQKFGVSKECAELRVRTLKMFIK